MRRTIEYWAILRKTNRDLDGALSEGRLVILSRESSASVTLANIEAAFSNAVSKGATSIRYLGNLGMGQPQLPGRGADEVVELETGATLLALRFRSSPTGRRVWDTSSRSLPGSAATQPVLRDRGGQQSCLAFSRHDC
jgi:hypothetical protein